MAGLVWGPVAVLLVLLLLLAAVLVSPVRIECLWRSSPRQRIRVTARLFGGLIPAIPLADSAGQKREANADAAESASAATPGNKHRKKRKKTCKPGHNIAGRLPGLVKRSPRLIISLLSAFRVERLDVDAAIGLADPADTGYLCGLLMAGTHAVPPLANSVTIRPVFSGPTATGSADMRVSVIPAAVIWPLVRFGWQTFGPRS